MTSASTKRRHERQPRTLEQRQDVEIQRLRAAMAHAMDEAEVAARPPLAWLSERMRWQKVVKLLETALEKK